MSYAGDVTPREAFDRLSAESEAVLVDVRTPAEWTYVGLPDLAALGKQVVTIPWHQNLTGPELAEQLTAAGADHGSELLFLCRSGQRSRFAAGLAAEQGFANSFNVAEGFEGRHDEHGHRGTVSGWKADGLPWRQS